MDPDEAMEEWISAYDLTSEQDGLMRSLFDRKMKDPQGTMTLNGDEEARELLGAIGIIWPSGRKRERNPD